MGKKIKMADALEEAEFEQILKEILLELEDKGRRITLQDEQRKAVKQLYGKKNLVAVLAMGFGIERVSSSSCWCY